MADPYVAEIVMVGFNFPPRGWAQCDGQLLSISQNTALFALIGTFYGGDGRSTFALPDLRGRTPIFWGQGPGLSNYDVGQTSGEENHTLLTSELPSHNHGAQTTLNSVSTNGNSKQPGGHLPSSVQGTNTNIYSANNPDTTNTGMFNLPGGAHNNLQPYLTVNFIIAMQGIFPPRS